MSTGRLRRANLAAIACDPPGPHLPEGFRRNSVTRIGASLGASSTGLSIYELPPGQASSPYHYEAPVEEWLLVVSGTPILRHPVGDLAGAYLIGTLTSRACPAATTRRCTNDSLSTTAGASTNG